MRTPRTKTAKNKRGATLNGISEMLGFVVKHMATREDLAELRKELKGDTIRLQTQVNSIEMNIREMRRDRLESRVSDLEEKVFGKSR